MYGEDTIKILSVLNKIFSTDTYPSYDIYKLKKILTESLSNLKFKKIDCPDNQKKPCLSNNQFISKQLSALAYKLKNCESHQAENIKLLLYFDIIKPNLHMINIIVSFIKSLNRIINNSENSSYTVNILYISSKKQFPPKGEILSADNINSGCTYGNSSICIWRSEELYKVLLHELIHLFNLDFTMKTENDTELLETVNSLFHIEGSNVLNEAFTEILAITLHSILIGLILSFEKVIYYEKLFTHLQIAKIIMHFNGTCFDDLFNITIKQTTSVLSYIIIKGILLNNYDKFINYLNEYYLKNKQRYKKYRELLLSLLNTSSLDKNLIDKFIVYLNNNNNEFINSTFRMSVYA